MTFFLPPVTQVSQKKGLAYPTGVKPTSPDALPLSYGRLVEIQWKAVKFIRSPMGQKNLAILMGDRINEGFLTRKCIAFCQVAKIEWP